MDGLADDPAARSARGPGRRAPRSGSRGRHAQALSALLALRPRLRLRDTIAAELWPEVDGPSAASLRQALWLIRSSLTTAGVDADDWLEADQDTPRPPAATRSSSSTRPVRAPRDRPADDDAERRSRSTAATCSRASATSASPRSASGCSDCLRGPPRRRRRAASRSGRRRRRPLGRDGAPRPRSAARGGPRRPDRRLRPAGIALAGRPPVPPGLRDPPSGARGDPAARDRRGYRAALASGRGPIPRAGGHDHLRAGAVDPVLVSSA